MQPAKQMLSELRPPAPKYTAKNVPDLTGQVAIVTGGNSGIGYETILVLLQRNARVYMASRNEQKANEAIQSIHRQLREIHEKQKKQQKSASGAAGAAASSQEERKYGELKFLKLDLADLAQVKQSAEEFKKQETKLHMLFASAGVMAPPYGSKTTQGHELQFGTNVLGHHLFFKLLLPTLEAAVASSGPGSARVCFTSSSGHNLHHPKVFDAEDPEWSKLKDGISAKWKLYGQSKLGNILQAQKYHRLYADKGIVITSCNPGNLRTNLARHSNVMESVGFFFARRTILYPSWYGALTQLYGCTAPIKEVAGADKGVISLAELQGAYLVPWARVTRASPTAYDEKAQEELYAWLEKESAAFV